MSYLVQEHNLGQAKGVALYYEGVLIVTLNINLQPYEKKQVLDKLETLLMQNPYKLVVC